MRHVDLCSGIGGFALGLSWAGLSEPVLFCELDSWCRSILKKHWQHVPIAEDVTELARDPARLVPDCDILTAGYPCQGFSVAGLQRGEKDDRYIWGEIFEIVQAKQPSWCIFENVAGHIALGLDRVLSDLEDKASYEVQTFCLPACSVNAPHLRNRIFIIAHTNRQSEPASTVNEQWLVGNTQYNGSSTSEEFGSHPENDGRTPQRSHSSIKSKGASQPSDHADVPDTSRVRHRGRSSQECGTAERLVLTQEQGRSTLGSEAEGRSKSYRKTLPDTDRKRGCLRNTEWEYAENAGQSSRNKRSNKRGLGTRNIKSRLGMLDDGLSARLARHEGFDFEPPDIPRIIKGAEMRTQKLKALGNALVPQIVEQIGIVIRKIEDDKVQG